MEQWRKDRTRTAWSLAWGFAIVFHRLLIPLLGGAEFEFTALLITIGYFGVITFLISWVFFLIPAWLVAVGLFFFGAVMELFIFQVIVDPILAGLFYIAMFFIPRWIANRIYADRKPEPNEA